MIIVLSDPTQENINDLVNRLEKRGYKAHISKGVIKTVIGAIGVSEEEQQIIEQLKTLPYVEDVKPILKPYKLASKEFKQEKTVIEINDVKIGTEEIVIMAGPCAVESEPQLFEIARFVKKCGAKILRGGAYKPRTSPYSFQGLEEEGLKILSAVKKETGLLIITELMSTDHLELLLEHADILQIGARNMQNFSLLKEVSKVNKPVLLKRGMAATMEELLMAAEYILSGGNSNVMLCERGIRTFEPYTRNTLDLSMIPVIKDLSHLPIIVDPSHGTGNWKIVTPMAAAAVAAGCDGLLIEVHPNPSEALSDGPQSLTFENFEKLMQQIRKVAPTVNRYIVEAQIG